MDTSAFVLEGVPSVGLQALYSKVRVGQKIKELREEKLRKTQAELAELLGAPGSQSQISLWEGGRVLPAEGTLAKIAVISGVDLNYFAEYPLYATGGAVGGVLIEVAELMSQKFPRDEVLDVLEAVVREVVEWEGMPSQNHAAWEGYLRGVGRTRRAEAEGDAIPSSTPPPDVRELPDGSAANIEEATARPQATDPADGAVLAQQQAGLREEEGDGAPAAPSSGKAPSGKGTPRGRRKAGGPPQ